MSVCLLPSLHHFSTQYVGVGKVGGGFTHPEIQHLHEKINDAPGLIKTNPWLKSAVCPSWLKHWNTGMSV